MSFTFGGTGGGNGSSQPFGSSSNTPQKPAASIFGSRTTPATSSPFSQPAAATSKPGLFGGLGATSGASPFGATSNTSGTQPASIFGSNPGSGTSTPAFGSSTGNAPNLFGAKPATSSSESTGGLFGKPSNTPTFSFGGPKKDESGSSTPNAENKAPTTQGGGLFGGLTKPPGASLFGTPSSNATTSAPPGSTTPAPTKTFNFNSTTPAGPPPTDNGQGPKAPTSNLFNTSSQPTSGSGLFGTALGSGNATSGSFTPKTAPAVSLFGTTPTSTPTGSAAPSSTAPAQEAPKLGFSFAPSATSTATSQLSSSATTGPTASLFAGSSKPNLSSSTAPGASSIFGNLGGPKTTATATSTTAAGAPSLFSSLAATPSTTSTNATAPSTTASAPGGLFGSQPATISSTQPSSKPVTTPPVGSSTGTAANPTQPGPPTMGASTAGPAPQMSRLKNKTMDEIITRWASDLLKYQKEFQDQATKVAAWDRLLVDNGEKIQKLYTSTFEAERASTEVERQLAAVEGQQAELTSWLDRYEADIDEMFARQVGQGESLQGPDQERERTYKLAEKLADRLDEMGKNITAMIEAINEASSNLSKNSKSDDPLSHIVRVLNSHLMQLQWIDQNAELLQQKVVAAQKLGQSIGSNGYGGQENDATDALYRSFMGRR